MIRGKENRRQMRHRRFLKRLKALNNRRDPRIRFLARKTSKHVYVVLIDDRAGRVITSFSSNSPALRKAFNPQKDERRRTMMAKLVGEAAALYALEKGITEVVFDRGGYPYQGTVREVAESARSAGLKL